LDEDQKAEKKHCYDEAKEITIISLAHAGANPGAVMIESLNANIAIIAMRGARRAIDVACITEFDLKAVSFYRH
jgi:hypothetical protein